MHSVRIIVFITIFIVVGCLPVSAVTTSLTLDECIRLGLKQNPEIRSYELAIEESERGIEQAWGAFLPTLRLDYRYNQLSNNSDSERDNDYLDQDSDSFSAQLTQPLFTGFSGIAGLKHARADKKYRQAQRQYMHNQLIQRISSSYYALLYAQRRTQQWNDSVTRLETQEEIAIAWVEQRLAPQLRLHEVATELSNARHELVRAQSDQEIAASQLREWLALHYAEAIQVEGGIEQLRTQPCSDLQRCIETALELRPEMTLSSLNIEMASQDAKSILARNLPRAELSASWTDYHREYDVDDYAGDDRDYYSVSLNLSMQPFQGGRTISEWRKQRIAIDRYRQQLAVQRNRIITELNTSFERLRQGHERLKDAMKGIEHARAAYDVATKSTEMGMYSLNDLLDAELRLTRAELKVTDAYYAIQQATVELEYALGENGQNKKNYSSPLQKKLVE